MNVVRLSKSGSLPEVLLPKGGAPSFGDPNLEPKSQRTKSLRVLEDPAARPDSSWGDLAEDL